MPDDFGLKLWKLSSDRKSARMAVFDPTWQDISDYFFPSLSNINTEKTEGTEDWTQRVYDTGPIRAGRKCSVGVRNWVTPSTDPWLGLQPPPNLTGQQSSAQPPAAGSARLRRITQAVASTEQQSDGMDDATRWTSDEAAGITQDLQSSNFYATIQPFNRGACVFGTALMYCEEGKNEALRFEQYKVGTFTVAESDQRTVDTVDRWFKLSLRQAAQKWGKDNLPKKQREMIDKGKWDAKFTYLHHVLPMEDFKDMGGVIEGDEGLGASQMAFASVWQDDQTKEVIMVGGYEEMPYFCLRWDSWGTDDVYGYSPAFETLPEARQINYITQFSDALVERIADPRVLIPDNLTGEVDYAAAGVTVVKADALARGEVPKEWMTSGRVEDVTAMIERKQKAIDDAFFVDVFTAISQLGDKVTASTLGAIALLQGEKLDQFTGTFDQYTTEFINPLVRRVMGLRLRSGRSKAPPDSLMVQVGKDPKAPKELAVPKIQIRSRVVMALNEIKNAGTQKTIATLQPLAEATHGTIKDIMDNFDLDEIARGTGRDNGMPEKYLRTIKDMKAQRDARQKQVEKQMALEQAKLASESAKNLGKAPPPVQNAVMEQFPQTQSAG